MALSAFRALIICLNKIGNSDNPCANEGFFLPESLSGNPDPLYHSWWCLIKIPRLLSGLLQNLLPPAPSQDVAYIHSVPPYPFHLLPVKALRPGCRSSLYHEEAPLAVIALSASAADRFIAFAMFTESSATFFEWFPVFLSRSSIRLEKARIEFLKLFFRSSLSFSSSLFLFWISRVCSCTKYSSWEFHLLSSSFCFLIISCNLLFSLISEYLLRNLL